MTEIRIGGTDDIDIMAREWSEDEPIDIFIRERFQRTEKGDLFLKLLLEVAPQNIGTRTPEDVAMYCASLARHAYSILGADINFSVVAPSQKILRRKIAKHKEKANGERN